MGLLLELQHVSKRYGHGLGQRTVLRDVSLALEPGELVVIWGRRRSGRSTLLRVAAGVEPPDSGVVRFAGSNLAGHRGDLLGGGIGYCQCSFLPTEGQLVLDQLIVSQLARGVPPLLAASRAKSALERLGAERCATLRPGELSGEEAVRVAIARAFALEPKLLVIDEPTLNVDLLVRDEILLLLRSLADEGIAVLASAGESTGLAGSDRALSIGKGELHGHMTPELAQVLPLRPPATRQASA
ncbi:MAG: ATP-binding cassette domain-containing protein [Solirubrobacteraceae bacterium]